MAGRKLIGIIGRGNVGSHLCEALTPAFRIARIDPRMPCLPDEIPQAILICVTDDAIPSVASAIVGLYRRAGIAVPVLLHTSGSVDVSVLSVAPNYGVLYPLQTFTSGVPLDYSKIPVFIEGNCPQTERLAFEIGRSFSTRVLTLDSKKRRSLHLASVFACNYANRMWAIAGEIMRDEGLDEELLNPLIEETAAKLTRLPANEAQTGPARRHDSETIARHLDMLASDKLRQEIYRLVAQDISEEY